MLNASPDEICHTENTTEGLNIVINGLSWRSGDEIITFDLEHSSVLIPSYFQRRRHEAVVKVLPLTTDESWDGILSKVEAALTERTRLVFLSHIQYSCGLRMPVREIRNLTRDRDILLLVDGAQTAGHISLDMMDLDCDFYAIPGHKWLLGSEGAGALYIRNDRIPQVEPMKVAGRAALPHGDPYQFEPNISSMDKFRLTSTSTALQAGMVESIGFIQAIGVGEIERRNLSLAAALKGTLQELPGAEGPVPDGGTEFLGPGLIHHLWSGPRGRRVPPLGQPPDSGPLGGFPSLRPGLLALLQYGGGGLIRWWRRSAGWRERRRSLFEEEKLLQQVVHRQCSHSQ